MLPAPEMHWEDAEQAWGSSTRGPWEKFAVLQQVQQRQQARFVKNHRSTRSTCRTPPKCILDHPLCAKMSAKDRGGGGPSSGPANPPVPQVGTGQPTTKRPFAWLPRTHTDMDDLAVPNLSWAPRICRDVCGEQFTGAMHQRPKESPGFIQQEPMG